MASNRFYQTNGPIGSMNQRSAQFASVANPWVRQQLISVGEQNRTAPATATLAGHKDSCCSDCAAANRKNHV